jgi:hypothetical protein
MTETTAGTSGGAGGTGGDAPRRRRIAALIGAAVLFIAVQSVANVESTIDDMAKTGVSPLRWHVWTWQLSSALVWVALMAPLWWWIARIRPPRFGWPATIALHAAATVPVSLGHVAAMVAIRKLAYAAAGESYDFGGGGAAVLLYEYRKDVATYLMVGAFLAYAQWLLARPAAAPPAGPSVLLVADGAVTHRVPVDAIEWAAAAGNYVELSWEGRTLLHRSTLAALADQLGTDFVRIHRGRLVRSNAIRTIESDKSGDFTVTLASGQTLRGSRRYRAALEA